MSAILDFYILTLTQLHVLQVSDYNLQLINYRVRRKKGMIPIPNTKS